MFRTCQLVSRETPETIRRIPTGLRERGALREKERFQILLANGALSLVIPIPSFIVNFTTWSTFFGKLDNNTFKAGSVNFMYYQIGNVLDAHERFSVEIVHSVLSILYKKR